MFSSWYLRGRFIICTSLVALQQNSHVYHTADTGLHVVLATTGLHVHRWYAWS